MRRTWLFVAISSFFLLAPMRAVGDAAEARAALALLPWEGVQGSPPGSWVELALLVGGIPAGPHLRFLVLEREAEGTWLELWISQGPGSGSLVYQLLAAPESGGRLAIRRLLSRTLGGPVQELPVDRLAPAPSDDAARPTGASWREEEAPATVLTSAGSFRTSASALRQGSSVFARLWRSAEIPVFGLVRIEYAEGLFGLEVAAFGRDGKPLIPPSSRPSRPPAAGTP